jgi:hypothetical protein
VSSTREERAAYLSGSQFISLRLFAYQPSDSGEAMTHCCPFLAWRICLVVDALFGAHLMVNGQPGSAWFSGMSFQITGRNSRGHAPTLDNAQAAFRAEYITWRGTQNSAAG